VKTVSLPGLVLVPQLGYKRLVKCHINVSQALNAPLQWRTHKIFKGGGQWHIVVICLWCALFVTSQFDVIFMIPNERFGEVC